jgi:serine protease
MDRQMTRTSGTLLPILVLLATMFPLSTAGIAGGPRGTDAPPAAAGIFDDRYIVSFHQYGPHAPAAIIAAGGRVVRELPEVSAVAAKLPEAALQGLRNHPQVSLIEVDARRYPLQATPLWSDLVAGAEIIPYGIQMIQADQLSGAAAGNRTVCVIDSGYSRSHLDLQAADVTSSPDIGSGDPFKDFSGHGTHVAGTIAAVGGNSTGVRGVIDTGTLKLHIVKVFGDDGRWAYSSDLVSAVTQCRTAGAHVISMSLGGSDQVAAENTALTDAWDAGVLSVAAAGNRGDSLTSYPAGYTSVISVAAVDSNEVVAAFSQFNDTVELAAPGVAVLSTVPLDEINTVAADETSYSGFHVEYSGRTGGLNGDLVSGGLCTATDGSWFGKVVVCERGTASFYEKVMNVEQSGGVAAVIYNNVPGPLYATLGDGNSSIIPAISLSQSDGQLLLGHEGLAGTMVSLDRRPVLDAYEYYDGTSMATPHVSGAAALIWSYDTSWTNAQIRQALQDTAKDKGDPGLDIYYGHGIIQAKAALEYLCGPDCPITPPVPPAPAPASDCFTDSELSDFGHYAGVVSNVDLTTAAGDVFLAYDGFETVDQQQTAVATFDTITSTNWTGQTFVAGRSGRLTAVEFRGYLHSGAPGEVGIELRTVEGDLPTATVLASASFYLWASVPSNYRVNIEAPVSVTADTTYALVFRPLSGGTYAISRTNNNQYAGGSIVSTVNSGTSWSTTKNRDHYFRTFVAIGTLHYYESGTLESATRNSDPAVGYTSDWTALSWSATTPGSTSVRFQAAASNSYAGPYVFIGPDGTSSTYFDVSGASLDQLAGMRYLRYRAYLATSDPAVTPTLHSVTVCYQTLEGTNAAPVLGAIGDRTVAEGSTLAFTVTATDADGDELAYSATGLPTGASLDATTGAFSWTPDYTQSGIYTVTFMVSDGVLTDSETITITVTNTNRAPVMGAIGDRSVAQGVNLSFTVGASDADDDPLSYSATGLPTGATFDGATGLFSWTPGFTQSGPFEVTFTVSDGDLEDFETITITVTLTNQAPVLDAIGDRTVAEGSALEFTVTATDADGDELTYGATGLPMGTTFDSATGFFSWTPSYEQAGTYEVTFTVSDGVLTDSEMITITVTNTNRAPMLSEIGDRSGRPGELLSFTISATDPDMDVLTYSGTGLPAGATLDEETGEFSWTPASNQTGTHEVTFSVDDGMGGTDSEQITIRVSAGLKFYTLTPCRVVDTRLENGAYGSPALNHDTTRSFVMTGQCGIPATAKAVSLNATIAGPTSGPGFLTLYPGGTVRPMVSMLNYRAGLTRANNAIAPLGADGSLTAYIAQGAGTADLIIDVNGYFE